MEGIITHFKHAVEKIIFQLARLGCALGLRSNLGALLQTLTERLGQKLKEEKKILNPFTV